MFQQLVSSPLAIVEFASFYKFLQALLRTACAVRSTPPWWCRLSDLFLSRSFVSRYQLEYSGAVLTERAASENCFQYITFAEISSSWSSPIHDIAHRFSNRLNLGLQTEAIDHRLALTISDEARTEATSPVNQAITGINMPRSFDLI